MDELILELKQKIVEALNLENAALFGDGLGLDSIDALELIVLLDKTYGIRLADPKEGREIFRSIRTMAEYITKHRTK